MSEDRMINKYNQSFARLNQLVEHYNNVNNLCVAGLFFIQHDLL